MFYFVIESFFKPMIVGGASHKRKYEKHDQDFRREIARNRQYARPNRRPRVYYDVEQKSRRWPMAKLIEEKEAEGLLPDGTFDNLKRVIPEFRRKIKVDKFRRRYPLSETTGPRQLPRQQRSDPDRKKHMPLHRYPQWFKDEYGNQVDFDKEYQRDDDDEEEEDTDEYEEGEEFGATPPGTPPPPPGPQIFEEEELEEEEDQPLIRRRHRTEEPRTEEFGEENLLGALEDYWREEQGSPSAPPYSPMSPLAPPYSPMSPQERPRKKRKTRQTAITIPPYMTLRERRTPMEIRPTRGPHELRPRYKKKGKGYNNWIAVKKWKRIQ